jgi:hypothetical protein
MGLFDNLGKVSDDVVAAAKIAGDAYKAGVQAQASTQLLEKVLARLVDPKLLSPVLHMGLAAGQGFLQAQVYDPKAAVDPAYHVLSAAADIRHISDTVREWAFAPTRMSLTDHFRPHLFWGHQKMETTEQIQRLANILWAAAGECDLAGSQILQKYNPLSAVLPLVPQPASPPDIQRADCPIPMPLGSYRDDKRQVMDVRARVGILADYLYSMAGRCIVNIKSSNLDRGLEVSANIVRSEGALIVQRTVEAMAACIALARLANQPIAIHKDDSKRTGLKDEQHAPLQDAQTPEQFLGPPAPAA